MDMRNLYPHLYFRWIKENLIGGIFKEHMENFESNIHIHILMVVMILQVYICVSKHQIAGLQQEWHQEDDGIGSLIPSFPHGDMNLLTTNQHNASVRNPETSSYAHARWVWIPNTLYAVFPSLSSLAQCSVVYLGGNL